MQSLPADFIGQMTALLGDAETERLVQALAAESPVSIRPNPRKPFRLWEGMRPVAWSSQGFYLRERPSFTFDPRFHAGCYYVQEAGSMFIEQAVRAFDTLPRRVLDLCAAPGGKSTLWRSLLPDGALLVANEPLGQRAMILAENMAKWGHPDVMVTEGFPRDFARLPGFFDVVAADVPCSGEGMFRKDDGAIADWSLAAVARCAERQREIVADVWPALRQGGYFVYSTCTFNRAEDEDTVRFICEELGAEPVNLPYNDDRIVGEAEGYHFYPHRTESEGFFLALLRKTSPAPTSGKRLKRTDRTAAPPNCLWRPDDFRSFYTDASHICAVRRSLFDDVQHIKQTVHTLSAGIALYEEKGHKLIPQHALALSSELADTAFPQIDLSCENAISYLRRETINLPSDTPRGYVVAAYEGHRLGFLNHLGNRSNNLYPSEWRIRNVRKL